MKKILFIPLLLITLLLASCQKVKTYDVVTTLFPQYDISKEIIGDKGLSVHMLLRTGQDGHAFEPTSKEMIQIKKSKIFFYTSLEMEPWVKKITPKDGVFVDLSHILHEPHASHDHEHDHDHDHDENLHYWTVIDHLIRMTDEIMDNIIKIDKENELYYRDNALALKEKLTAIKQSFINIDNKDTRDLYYIGHNVFSLFSTEVGIHIESLTDAYTSDANPSSTQIKTMIEKIKSSDTHILYYDLIEGFRLASSIEKDLLQQNYAVTLLPLHSLHNITKTQKDNNVTLIDLLNENLDHIKRSFTKE